MKASSSTTTRVAALIAALLLVVAGVHIAAVELDQAARDQTREATERVRLATLATRLEPWNERIGVTLAIAEARGLLNAGDVDAAYWSLLPLSTSVRGDALFTETYRETVRLKLAIDARKAHQQHSREGEHGELAPDDVER